MREYCSTLSFFTSLPELFEEFSEKVLLFSSESGIIPLDTLLAFEPLKVDLFFHSVVYHFFICLTLSSLYTMSEAFLSETIYTCSGYKAIADKDHLSFFSPHSLFQRRVSLNQLKAVCETNRSLDNHDKVFPWCPDFPSRSFRLISSPAICPEEVAELTPCFR